MLNAYTKRWFAGQAVSARRSAGVIVPLVMDLLAPTSVVDVGCGTGAWLAEFVGAGVADVLGIDGDYVDRAALAIPADKFLACDLSVTIPVTRRFDLAMSLEVAEHLPERAAASFVRTLTEFAPLVLFGAAIPGQGGNHHVNEQWQSYWAALFRERGFVALDPFRPATWTRHDVDPWYRQNTLLYASGDLATQDPRIARLCGPSCPVTTDLVHPELFAIACEEARRPIRTACRRAVSLARKAVGGLVPKR